MSFMIMRSWPHQESSDPWRLHLQYWLPESLIPPTMDYLRYNILTRMNLVVNESRSKAYDNAVKVFNELRRGDFVPESDETGEGEDQPPVKANSPIAGTAKPERMLD